ncbi:MAG: lamin tail domain-containing protein, partial [Planctomycetes bacterium]|nr:lamin tail domain-containing protein [Planctomycetota bacterium]
MTLRSVTAWLPLCLLLAGHAAAPAQDLLITEILADNNSSILDEDGAASDWIEIHNADSDAVNIGGWFLTDARRELTLWRFPSLVLEPQAYLVVFASGKNRSSPAGELHTSFRLDRTGEYLALVRPDGTSVACAFDPFPLQLPDVSYGLSQQGEAAVLVASAAPARAWVPTDSSLEPGWYQRVFDDSGWLAGSAAIGYDVTGEYDHLIDIDLETAMRNANPTAYLRVPFTVEDPASVDALDLLVKYDDGFVAYINGRQVARRNAPLGPAWDATATAEHGTPEASWMEQ